MQALSKAQKKQELPEQSISARSTTHVMHHMDYLLLTLCMDLLGGVIVESIGSRLDLEKGPIIINPLYYRFFNREKVKSTSASLNTVLAFLEYTVDGEHRGCTQKALQ